MQLAVNEENVHENPKQQTLTSWNFYYSLWLVELRSFFAVLTRNLQPLNSNRQLTTSLGQTSRWFLTCTNIERGAFASRDWQRRHRGKTKFRQCKCVRTDQSDNIRTQVCASRQVASCPCTMKETSRLNPYQATLPVWTVITDNDALQCPRKNLKHRVCFNIQLLGACTERQGKKKRERDSEREREREREKPGPMWY